MNSKHLTTFWQSARRQFLRAPKRFLALFVLTAILLYSVSLGLRVVNEFEHRRWDVPAHVYAAPLELYAGLELNRETLAAELERTGHQRVPALQRPGEFVTSAGELRVWTRAFTFWDGEEPSRRLRFAFDRGRIASIADDAGAAIPLLRLEPMRVGSVFNAHHEDRILIEPNAIPPLLIEALKAVEDRKFDRHHGLDLTAIVRAALVNLRHGEIRQGGSTLTQQLVKSYFLDGRKTFRRKFREAIMAVALELRYEKAALLHAYVNEIYLGQQGTRAIHGFGLASEFYFAKRVNELAAHELALLVAIVKGPSFYDPRRQPERATERRNRVLDILAERGLLDEQTAADARQQSLGVTARAGMALRYQPAYMDLVRAQLADDYSADDLATQGLRVFTNLDPTIQTTAERELALGLERLAETPPSDANLEETDAEVADASPLEGAVVVTRPQTGDVVALVGGGDAVVSGFNRALDARRPVGSLIKPLVYLAALESGEYTLASQLLDEALDVELPNGTVWSPQNFSLESHGEVSFVRALAESYNQATVRLGLDVGVEHVAALFERLGLETAPAAYPSLLLGAVDLSPFEVAQLYNSLANGGDRVPLRAVRSVTGADGQALTRYPLEIVPAAEPDAVYQLNQALVQAVERGTGRTAYRWLPPGLTAAGKTGTSDDYKDSWFAGFTQDHLAVVWVGRDDNTPTGFTGSAGALPIWAPIVATLESTAGFDPVVAESLETRWVDYESGLMTRRGCGDAVLLPIPTASDVARRPCGLGRALRGWLDGLEGKR
ncbi:MAG: penicillin-binding protein 1B [Pseudomonadota bacterium]